MTSWGNVSTSSFMAEGTVRVSLVKCLRVEKVYGSAVNIFSGFMRSLINRVYVYLLLTGRAFRTSTVWDTGPGRGCVWQILTGCVMAEPKFCIRLYCSNSKAIVIVQCWTYNICVLGLMHDLLFCSVFVCQNDCILTVSFCVSQMFQVLYLTCLGWGLGPRNFWEAWMCSLGCLIVFS